MSENVYCKGCKYVLPEFDDEYGLLLGSTCLHDKNKRNVSNHYEVAIYNPPTVECNKNNDCPLFEKKEGQPKRKWWKFWQ